MYVLYQQTKSRISCKYSDLLIYVNYFMYLNYRFAFPYYAVEISCNYMLLPDIPVHK